MYQIISIYHQPRHENCIPCKSIWQIYRDKQQLQEKETSQNDSRLQFFCGQSSQSYLEEKDSSCILKDNFWLRKNSSLFTSINTSYQTTSQTKQVEFFHYREKIKQDQIPVLKLRKIRLEPVKKTNMLNPIKSLGYIKFNSSSSIKRSAVDEGDLKPYQK